MYKYIFKSYILKLLVRSLEKELQVRDNICSQLDHTPDNTYQNDLALKYFILLSGTYLVNSEIR